MLESLRDKLFSPQEPTESTNSRDDKDCDFDAGASLLEKYQNDWIEIHNLNEENAKRASEVDTSIGQLLKKCNDHWNLVSTLTLQLSSLSTLRENMKDLAANLVSLENKFEEVEKSLVNFENITEVQKLQERQLDERFQLALYKEKKLAELEVFKAKSHSEHLSRVNRHEAERQSKLQERQETFRIVFEEEMRHYKEHGRVEKVSSVRDQKQESLSLEDIEIDQENNVLDDFFAAEAVEAVEDDKQQKENC